MLQYVAIAVGCPTAARCMALGQMIPKKNSEKWPWLWLVGWLVGWVVGWLVGWLAQH